MGRKQTRGCPNLQRMPIGSPSTPLSAEALDEQHVSETPSKNQQLASHSSQLEAEVTKLESELQQEKCTSRSLDELHQEKERQLEQFKKDCAEWKEEAESWKRIANQMKCQRAKFKEERDQLHTEVADINQQLWLKVQDVAGKDAEFAKLSEIAQESVAQWYWSGNDDQTHAFDMAANPQLEQAYRSSRGQGTMELQSGVHIYEVCFETMTQTNVESGRQRGIHRREFGAHDADPVVVVKLALAARSQEAEVARVQCARAHKEHEKEMTKVQAFAKEKGEELLACQTSKKMLETQLEESQRRLHEHASATFRAKEEARLLKEDIKKLQCKDQGARKLIEDLQHQLRNAMQDVDRERSEAERREHALQEHCTDLEEKLRTEVASRQEVTRERDALLKTNRDSGSLADEQVRSIVEFWKAPVAPGKVKKVEESSGKIGRVVSLFKELSHKNVFFHGLQPSKCHAFQQLKVHSVYSLHNPCLWRKYAHRKEELRSMHSESAIKAKALDPSVHGISSLVEGLKLDASLNEVLLGTGCSETAASSILKEGFDIRFTGTSGGSMYGEGLYFSTEMCKCNQYTDTQGPSRLRHIIIARVTLGDPCFLKGPYQGRHPPLRVSGGDIRYDSNVVDPRLSQCGQAHWEYVIFDGALAYPEMLVTYEVP